MLGLGMLALATQPLTIAGAQTVAPNATPAFGGFCSPLPCDPGVRRGPAGAGGALSGLNGAQSAMFTAAQTTFEETDTVAKGLGPRFNMDSCSGCHNFPAAGGSSPATNPQIAVATAMGATNSVPDFITASGPVREVRFIKNADGTPDGGVHDLFTITGRSDSNGCSLSQPNFGNTQNIIFRIPTPTFGAGLIAAIPDSAILDNMTKSSGQNGVSGHPNYSGNDGSITRFGWKAQNKSLVIFAGEAYNVEQGVTNEVFPDEREQGCLDKNPLPLPEDFTHLTGNSPSSVLSDVNQFAQFMQMLAPPTPLPPNRITSAGADLFKSVGCATCHTPSMTTGASEIAALSKVQANLYSDLLVHNMGSGLADNINQGNAGGDEFRTAPLWGVGQRLFFLHDGRETDLLKAIEDHFSSGSEANTVINNFNALSPFQREAVLIFLRSL
jgi:CxxC motif-containing protein (DUF1111 family)